MACTVSELLLQARSYDVVLICGLYKSGTSLAATLMEQEAGLFNPAAQTNAAEQAHGQQLERYSTQECAELREVNSYLLYNKDPDYEQAVAAYIQKWTRPIVLKDPRFVYTLSHWLKGLDAIDYSFYVLFTSREERALRQAWARAPLTSKLLAHSEEHFERWQAQWHDHRAICEEYGIPHATVSLKALRDWQSGQ